MRLCLLAPVSAHKSGWRPAQKYYVVGATLLLRRPCLYIFIVHLCCAGPLDLI